MAKDSRPSTPRPQRWSNAREALQIVRYPPHLRQTGITALIVGTVLFIINHLNTVLAGMSMADTFIKGSITYLVPFTVANVGLLLGSRRTPDPEDTEQKSVRGQDPAT